LAAAGIAVGLYAGLDRRAEAERHGPVAQVEELVRALRLRGLDEDAIQDLVCNHSGAHWEEFFAAIFGYEATLEARERLARAGSARARPTFAPLCDPIARWLDAKIAARRQATQKATLQKIEERNLESQGVNLVTARRKAQRAAEAMVTVAGEIRESLRVRDGTLTVNHSVAAAIREAALNPEKVLVGRERGLLSERRPRVDMTKLIELVVGPKVRFLAGVVLLAGCIAWMHQNTMISQEHAAGLVTAAKTGDMKAVQLHVQSGLEHARQKAAHETTPLDLPIVPADLLVLVSSFGAGVGGLILICSAFFSGARIALFAIPAAAIPVLGPVLNLPTFGILDPSVAPSLVGAAIMAAGVLLGRTKG
jgi:hypothetical protein